MCKNMPFSYTNFCKISYSVCVCVWGGGDIYVQKMPFSYPNFQKSPWEGETPFPHPSPARSHCSLALPSSRPLKNPGYTSERGAKSLEFAFKNVPTIRREASPTPGYATNNFRINDPYFSIGITHFIQFSD